MFVFSQCVSWVVYNFHGQTIRLAVWANVIQNSAASKVRPGIAFTICVQISFIYRETAAKTLNWYQRWFWRKETRPEKQKKTFWDIPLLLEIFHWNFLKSCQVFHLPVLSNCIFVNGKQPCSPSWCFHTMPMTSCNGSIVHLPRLLDFLHCCFLQMRAQRWIYRARRVQWSTQVSS